MIYEVKVYADSDKVLNKKGHISKSFLKAFDASSSDEDFLVQYIDDPALSNYKNKVSLRIRKSEDDAYHELQYKKRYPIIDGNLDAALEQAARDGMTGKAEVEFSTNRQTLSVSTVKKVDAKAHVLPDSEVSHQHFIEHAEPHLMPHTALEQAIAIGPVQFERHKSKYHGYKLKIEKWEIKHTVIVELSSKVNSLAEAEKIQTLLINQLKALDCYQAEDQLKTDLIFKNYS